MAYVIFFILMLLINFIYNLSKFKQCIKFINWYEKWLIDPSFTVNLAEYKSDVKSLVENAGIKNKKIPYEEAIGLEYARTMTIDPIEQFPHRVDVIAITILRTLSDAKGIYRKRMYSSFNPIAWVETVLTLPKMIMRYTGFENSKKIINVMQIIWWAFVVIIIPTLIAAYTPELSSFIRGSFKKIFGFY